MVKKLGSSKVLVVLLGIAMICGIVITFRFSYAISNNTIYTRDEVSEIINDIKDKGSYIYIGKTGDDPFPLNTDTLIDGWSSNSSYDTSLFSLSSSNLTINKNGTYKIIVTLLGAFNTPNSVGVLKVHKNGGILSSVYITSPVEKILLTEERTLIVNFQANDYLNFTFNPAENSSFSTYFRVIVEYLGE